MLAAEKAWSYSIFCHCFCHYGYCWCCRCCWHSRCCCSVVNVVIVPVLVVCDCCIWGNICVKHHMELNHKFRITLTTATNPYPTCVNIMKKKLQCVTTSTTTTTAAATTKPHSHSRFDLITLSQSSNLVLIHINNTDRNTTTKITGTLSF